MAAAQGGKGFFYWGGSRCHPHGTRSRDRAEGAVPLFRMAPTMLLPKYVGQGSISVPLALPSPVPPQPYGCGWAGRAGGSFAPGGGGHRCPSWFLSQRVGGTCPLTWCWDASVLDESSAQLQLLGELVHHVCTTGLWGGGMTAWQRTQASGPPPFPPQVTPEGPLCSTTCPHCPPEQVTGYRHPGTPPRPLFPGSIPLPLQAPGPPPHRGCGVAAGLCRGQDGAPSSRGLPHLWRRAGVSMGVHPSLPQFPQTQVASPCMFM